MSICSFSITLHQEFVPQVGLGQFPRQCFVSMFIRHTVRGKTFLTEKGFKRHRGGRVTELNTKTLNVVEAGEGEGEAGLSIGRLSYANSRFQNEIRQSLPCMEEYHQSHPRGNFHRVIYLMTPN